MLWLIVARGDGPDPTPVAICHDPAVVRLALLRGREELDRALADTRVAIGTDSQAERSPQRVGGRR